MLLPNRSLPTQKPQSVDHAVSNRSSRTIAVAPQNASGPTQRVLLLDDQADFRDAIEEYLVSRLYEITAVSNGAEGLRKIMNGSFDLIICDMMMPQVGGEMFYWAVTRVRAAAALRFIFITGHQNDPKIQSFFQRVNATVLIKPFALEDLNSAIVAVEKKLL